MILYINVHVTKLTKQIPERWMIIYSSYKNNY